MASSEYVADGEQVARLIPWRNTPASVRRALVLAAVPGFLLTGTEVRRWR